MENFFLNDEGFIIPYKAIIELNKILIEKKEEKNIYVQINKNSLLVRIGEVDFFIRLTDKKFPDYKRIVQGEVFNKISVSIDKDKIRSTLKRMSIISNENNRPVFFSFKENIIEISTEDPELGNVKEILEIKEKVKENFSFCINCTYLLDIITAVDDDIFIEFNIEEENKPIVVKPVNKKEKVKYIIMPMLMD